MEATSVEIGTPQGAIALLSAYKRPQIALEEADIDALLTLGGNVIIAGDINAKHFDWGSQACNAAGIRLRHYLNRSNQLDISPPPSITHLRTDFFTGRIVGDILDIVLHSPALHVTTPKLLHDLTSDPFPILFVFHRQAFPAPNATIATYENELDKL